METKFTSAPWIVEDHRAHGDWRVSDHIWARNEDDSGPGKRICTINWDKIGSNSDPKEIEERTANAHLIASSPAMYKELEFLKGVLENNSLASGVCCCGYAMDNHPMYENHAPVDSGEYAQKKIMKSLNETLAQARGEG